MRRRIFIDLFWDESGETAIEYALLAGFVSIMIYAGAKSIGTKLAANYFGPVTGNLN